jgi:(p)ppGpp synthase/HD superfamily hydrolase
MGWIEPKYSKSEVDIAGRTLIQSNNHDEVAAALDVINNFRASHNFPLNTMQCGLRRSATKLSPDVIIAQRIKRLKSILYKLERFDTMRLSAMQDIAGCRAVVPSVDQVYELISIQRKSKIKHKMAKLTDYIKNPKPSGYRGCHLIYNYFSDRTEKYNGLNVEMQIRSMLQHYWATTVETASMFMQQSLKSSVGDSGWLRFFALMGTVHAFS